MFGLFESDVKKVRKLRLEFEDIRQRVLYKMNGYEQYCFGSAYESFLDEFSDRFESIPISDCKQWQEIGIQLREMARNSWNDNQYNSVSAEGGRAGSEAIALFSLQALANVFSIAAAKTLRTDIATSGKKILHFMEVRESAADMLSVE